MIKTVENFLENFNLKNSDTTFLVGFSGGYDSMCLLDILNNFAMDFGFKLVALHLNHNWRGEESRQEEANCKNFCKKRNIEFISETLDESTPKTESAARDARYAFFIKNAAKYNNPAIFTAHNSTDNAETLVYRMIKGTGLRGLRGILPKIIKDNYPVYRPLLTISRNQIEDYCKSKGLAPNNDSSNSDTHYKRNYIRHKIMPLFKEINFNAEKSINSLASLAISQSNIISEYMKFILKEIYVDEKLLTDKFKLLSEDVMHQIIYDACLKFDLDYDRKKINNILEFIKNNFDSKSGSRYSLTKELWIFANSKYIYLINNVHGEEIKRKTTITAEGEWPFSNNMTFSIEKYSGESNLKFPKENELYAYVNLKDLNLTIRTKREGDYITPFGMTGKMKLKKYLNSKGVSLHEKNELILLCKDQEVLWVAGVGLSNKLKVVNEPTHVIRLSKNQ